MSVNLLKYPTKPNEVADDLESVVYIVKEALLRFHPHDLSYETLDKYGLAFYVSQVFYEMQAVSDRYVIGGWTKHIHILAGRPGFQLPPDPITGKESEMQLFLTELYKLLRTHYAAIPPEQLAPFSVTIPKPFGRVASNPSDPGKLGKIRAKFNRVPLSQSSLPSLRAKHDEPELIKNPIRVLDTHNQIITLFEEFLSLSPQAFIHEKTKDQFIGLSRVITIPPSRPASGSLAEDESRVWVVPPIVNQLNYEGEIAARDRMDDPFLEDEVPAVPVDDEDETAGNMNSDMDVDEDIGDDIGTDEDNEGDVGPDKDDEGGY